MAVRNLDAYDRSSCDEDASCRIRMAVSTVSIVGSTVSSKRSSCGMEAEAAYREDMSGVAMVRCRPAGRAQCVGEEDDGKRRERGKGEESPAESLGMISTIRRLRLQQLACFFRCLSLSPLMYAFF